MSQAVVPTIIEIPLWNPLPLIVMSPPFEGIDVGVILLMTKLTSI